MYEQVVQKTCAGKLIAIIRGMEESLILPLAQAIHRGGIDMIEVTFHQADPGSFAQTARSIRAMRQHLGEDVVVGAGTVVSAQQVELAAEAGAAFIVSPNVDVAVIRATRERGLVSMPGAATASEALTAHNAGADFIKLFPAAQLGPDYLKALRAPLSQVRFLAVGGINENNAATFLDAGAVGLGVGGNLVNREWIQAGRFDRIAAVARQLVQAVAG